MLTNLKNNYKCNNFCCGDVCAQKHAKLDNHKSMQQHPYLLDCYCKMASSMYECQAVSGKELY